MLAPSVHEAMSKAASAVVSVFGAEIVTAGSRSDMKLPAMKQEGKHQLSTAKI
jgi:hypothetical protein